MRRSVSAFLSALFVLAFSFSAFAADDKKIDVMNPYKTQQKQVTDKSIATNKAYNDRWYGYVEERYGGKIDRPADDDKASGKDKSKSDTSKDDDEASDTDDK